MESNKGRFRVICGDFSQNVSLNVHFCFYPCLHFYGFWLSYSLCSWLLNFLFWVWILGHFRFWQSVLETVCPIFAMNTLLCRTESICLRLNGIKTRKSFINSSWCQVRNSSSEKKDDSSVNGKRLYNWSYLQILTYVCIHCFKKLLI